MALGFHLFAGRPRTLEEARKVLDALAAGLQFRPFVIEDGGWKVRYCRREEEVGLSILIDCEPQHLEVYIHPITEQQLSFYGPEMLVKFFSVFCIGLDADMGRSFPDTGYYIVKPSEITGTLEFVDWYQYFSPKVTQRWGLDHLRKGPFYKVEEYSNRGCGVWLAPSPQEPLGRMRAAQYLGFKLPAIYGRNPQTGQEIELPWH